MSNPAPAPSTGATTGQPAALCPACHSPATGKYCSNCGAPLAGARCTACSADLTPGAKFCHRCGTPANARAVAAGTSAEHGLGSALPWAVAAIALVTLIALVAGQHFSRSTPTNVAAAADPSAPALEGGGGAPPDISQMSPEERAERLYDRVMALSERGRQDSVQFFAPMAMQAYLMLGTLSVDQRYDLGRLAVASGEETVARAQADTILSRQPRHLLGLLLAADAAKLRGDRNAEHDYLRRFAAAAPSERAKQLPEYVQHVNEIDGRLGQSRSR